MDSMSIVLNKPERAISSGALEDGVAFKLVVKPKVGRDAGDLKREHQKKMKP